MRFIKKTARAILWLQENDIKLLPCYFPGQWRAYLPPHFKVFCDGEEKTLKEIFEDDSIIGLTISDERRSGVFISVKKDILDLSPTERPWLWFEIMPINSAEARLQGIDADYFSVGRGFAKDWVVDLVFKILKRVDQT